ncbi:hypothetical protein C0Q70_19664 [Pomacea canaliculata]|uniref:Uncharacterized protein n=1 Tax=Pomacea canaliculata TaxID=400727 RepID=A0A2T7NJY8_POMCA|nr:hypothetical protein C0Q70_19664 [Pomacea canaliculata]
MTTVGVQPQTVERVNALQLPSYAYHYPHFKRVQLAAVKEQLFHPNLPTLRRMEMDTHMQKLPDEHSRTSTTCGPGLAVVILCDVQSCCLTVLLRKVRDEWSAFLCKCPERFDIKLPEVPPKKDLHFTGYAVRYLRPDVTRGWRYTLQQEPRLDQFGQKPLPANIYARYRDTYPKYFRNVASSAWR